MDEVQSESLEKKYTIPITWAVAGFGTMLLWVVGATLYVADVRSETKINEVKVFSLEQRQTTLEQDVKTEIRRLADKIDELMDNKKRRKYGNY